MPRRKHSGAVCWSRIFRGISGMKASTITKAFTIIWPLSFLIGIGNGYLQLQSADSSARIALELASASIKARSADWLIPYTDELLTETYSPEAVPAGAAAPAAVPGRIPLSEGAFSMAIVGCGLPFLIQKPDPTDPHTAVSTLPSVLGSMSGYIPGFYAALKLGLGLDQTILTKEKFQSRVKNVSLDRLAWRITAHLRKHPGDVRKTGDADALKAFQALDEPTLADRASIHPLIFQYLSTTKGLELHDPGAVELRNGCVVFSLAGAALWVLCAIDTFCGNRITNNAFVTRFHTWFRKTFFVDKAP